MKSTPLDQLHVDPSHPRTIFIEGEIDALCEDLRKRGQIMPIIVFDHEGRAMIVDGARRYIAAKRACLTHMLAIVLPKPPSEAELRALQLRLDVHHASHNPMEQSKMLAQLKDCNGCSISELAAEVSIPQPRCSKLMALQRLAPAIQNLVATGALGVEKAATVSQIEDHDLQLGFVKEFAHLSPQAIRNKIKSNGKPVVKASRATFALAGDESITFKGNGATLEVVIERFTETVKRLRKGINDGYDISTVQKMFRDQAR
jgi:ParB/RepB/Spo0J family partition protein